MSMKIYISKVNESWVVDRFRKEWYKYNSDISTKFIKRSSNLWIIAPRLWEKMPIKFLEEKNVVCTIHHIDFEKFDKKEEENFYKLEKFVDKFHAISNKTFDQLNKLTDKEIHTIPFWINQNIWFSIDDKSALRDKFGFSQNDFLVGSFQRDTEGYDLKSPKLIKGPDIFLDLIKKMNENKENLVVVLTGKRRQYLIDNFEKFGIKYKYFEMKNFKSVNQLYNILDLYIVSSRIEGGPQAIVECGLTKTPILSTDVGIASNFLDPKSIYSVNNFFNAETNVDYAYKKSKEITIPNGMNKFKEMFRA
tara:strand:+ start:207 stop:1124 length:918 start_codon:yes stop_codon:yes gene_type:complete